MHFLPDHLQEFDCVQGGLSLVRADCVQRGLEQVDVVHPGDFHRVLEGQENALPGSFFRGKFKQVAPIIFDRARRDIITVPPGQHTCQGAFAGTVGTHDGMHFPGVHCQVQAFQNLFVLNPDL